MKPALTPLERATLAAFVDRLIPTDAHGAGAVEAGVVDFIESALAGPLAELRGVYAEGLAAVDELATSTRGDAFAELEPTVRDETLYAIETNSDPTLQAFFELVRLHAVHGMFSDPVHGGNRGYAGWDLLGFPGAKAIFTAEDQRLDARVAWVRDA